MNNFWYQQLNHGRHRCVAFRSSSNQCASSCTISKALACLPSVSSIIYSYSYSHIALLASNCFIIKASPRTPPIFLYRFLFFLYSIILSEITEYSFLSRGKRWRSSRCLWIVKISPLAAGPVCIFPGDSRSRRCIVSLSKENNILKSNCSSSQYCSAKLNR